MVGDLQISGSPSFFQPPFLPNSLGEHQLAFHADFLNTTTDVGGTGIFVTGRVMNRLANISTRLSVGTGDNVLIGGLIISGTSPKTVLLRGIGPSRSVCPMFWRIRPSNSLVARSPSV